jgi:hypothetical protein
MPPDPASKELCERGWVRHPQSPGQDQIGPGDHTALALVAFLRGLGPPDNIQQSEAFDLGVQHFHRTVPRFFRAVRLARELLSQPLHIYG